MCGLKASAADFVAQKRQNRKKSSKQPTTTEEEAEQVEGSKSSSEASSRFDRRRNLGFLIYGSAYQGASKKPRYGIL